MALMPPLAQTTGSALATNGTLTFAYPNRPGWPTNEPTLAGDFVGSFGHTAYAEGLQAALAYPTNFTLTFNATNITFTYLGTSTIPANTRVQLQLDTIGQNESIAPFTKYPMSGQISANPGSPGDASSQTPVSPSFYGVSSRVQDAQMVYVNLGSPLTASATSVVNAQARSGTNTVTTYSPAVTQDVPRTLQYVSSNVGDTTQTVIMAGLDEYGVAMTEKITLNGTTVVHGKKAFKVLISDTVSATLTGNLSVGSDTKAGLPVLLAGTTSGYVIKELVNGAAPTAGAFLAADLSAPTNTTGDPRGTYAPNTAFSGSTNSYELLIMAPALAGVVPQA